MTRSIIEMKTRKWRYISLVSWLGNDEITHKDSDKALSTWRITTWWWGVWFDHAKLNPLTGPSQLGRLTPRQRRQSPWCSRGSSGRSPGGGRSPWRWSWCTSPRWRSPWRQAPAPPAVRIFIFFMLFFYYFVIFFILFSIFFLLVHNVHKGSSHFAQIVSNMYIQQKRHAMSCISAVQGEKIITINLLYAKYKIYGTLLSTKTSKIHITLFIHC